MNTKTISREALLVIDGYIHFRFGSGVCSVPYFNNKTVRARAALRTWIGKGSAQDIAEEIHNIAVKSHIVSSSLSDESLKKLLADNNLGIECSGFAYYVLNAEGQSRNKGHISKHLSFPLCKGLLGKIRCSIRPVENCDVATFAHDDNSHIISITDAQPGDIITMTKGSDESDHILIIHGVQYEDNIPNIIQYSHAVAYPEDGLYGSGVRQGTIVITDIGKPLTDQLWNEGNNQSTTDRLVIRAQKSRTKIRRLNWF